MGGGEGCEVGEDEGVNGVDEWNVKWCEGED